MLTGEQQRKLLHYLQERFPDRWEEKIQKYKDKGLIPPIKPFKDLDIGCPDLHWCKRCCIRRVSKPKRKLCGHCGKIGGPPLNDSYRCKFIYKTALNGVDPGGRCNKPAIKSSDFCKRHNGRTRGGHGRFKKVTMRGVTLKVGRWYNDVLNDTLMSALEGMEADTPKELYEVSEEVKMARIAAKPHVQRYAAMQEWYQTQGKQLEKYIETAENAIGSGTLNPEDLATAKEYLASAQSSLSQGTSRLMRYADSLQEAMAKVAKLSESGSAIHERHSKSVEIEQLQLFVSQVISIFYDICGRDYEHLAKDLEKRIQEEVRLPGIEGSRDQSKGATTQVDQMLAQMASTLAITHEP